MIDKKQYYIVGAGDFTISDMSFFKPTGNDFIIAVDGGFDHLKKIKKVPDLYIGDFDSVKSDIGNVEKIKLPKEKDDTDMHYSIKFAIKNGAKDIKIFGGVGGRLDHTIANLQSLFYCFEKNVPAKIYGGEYKSFFVSKKYNFPVRKNGIVSIFSFCKKANSVTIKGLKYETTNRTLTNNFPIGISNEFIGSKNAYVSIKENSVLVQESY